MRYVQWRAVDEISAIRFGFCPLCIPKERPAPMMLGVVVVRGGGIHHHQRAQQHRIEPLCQPKSINSRRFMIHLHISNLYLFGARGKNILNSLLS